MGLQQSWQEILAMRQQEAMRRGGVWFDLTSRIHPLRNFSDQLWLKRDDELGILGSKTRKMQGLAWAIDEAKTEILLASGGSRSQFLFGLAQLARERGLQCKLLIKEGSPRLMQGMDTLWPLLIEAKWIENIRRSQWADLEILINQRYEALTQAGQRVFRVCEGGAQREGLWGALTLPQDIIRQEKQMAASFSHILIDAGTGLTAHALIIGLGLLQSKAVCEVLLCAGDRVSFARDLENRRQELMEHLQIEVPLAAYRCHRPTSARSFGSTNKAVFQEIARSAHETGVLFDPIYSAKLMMKARELQSEWSPRDTVLLIHSGGTMSLFGFAAELNAAIS